MMYEWIEWIIRAGLFVVGLGVVVHYQLISNFITAAPHWIKAVALPLCTGGGIGMIACALSGAVLVGLGFALWSCAAVMAVQLEAWREGVHVSEQFAKAAQFKRNKAAMIRDWVLNVEEFHQDFYPEREPAKSKTRESA
jgi:cytochrome c oxidase assembly factor CtaG